MPVRVVGQFTQLAPQAGSEENKRKAIVIGGHLLNMLQQFVHVADVLGPLRRQMAQDAVNVMKHDNFLLTGAWSTHRIHYC
ncbi:hypothetical protein DOH12_24045 [Salmonella enterica subsp. enterica]|nr:hypothetical protein [Salmonella enterica subsp. enterica serovar Sandiego]EAA3660543.1 hypothetical protein [Salmonella enterica subsp. enterica serovar Sandiego]MLY08202.1 hypothetical protein [Salmonella enterica subsp. enterica serovar Sandiego]